MSKKKSSPGKSVSNKGKSSKNQVQKGWLASKKLWIAVGGAILLAIALTVILILVCGSEPEFAWETLEKDLNDAGYSVGDYVAELNGYKGVVKTLYAFYSKTNFETLADYVNAEEIEVINFVQFNNEENAKSAYELFLSKWADKYDKYGMTGEIIYFGTSEAYDIATKNLK